MEYNAANIGLVVPGETLLYNRSVADRSRQCAVGRCWKPCLVVTWTAHGDDTARRASDEVRCSSTMGTPPRSVDDFAAFDLLAGLFDLGEHIVVRDRGFDEHFLLFERDVVGGDACRERDGTGGSADGAMRIGLRCSEWDAGQCLEGWTWLG